MLAKTLPKASFVLTLTSVPDVLTAVMPRGRVVRILKGHTLAPVFLAIERRLLR